MSFHIPLNFINSFNFFNFNLSYRKFIISIIYYEKIRANPQRAPGFFVMSRY